MTSLEWNLVKLLDHKMISIFQKRPHSFQFNNVNYIQTLGTAMKTKMTPTYATLTVAYLEKNLYEIIGKNMATT